MKKLGLTLGKFAPLHKGPVHDRNGPARGGRIDRCHL